jgi:phage shock protein C
MKRLHLSRKNRKISGVCGGIGETYDIDPNLVRLTAVFLALVTGVIPMVLTYIVARLILPWPEQE